jgi:uncharacterized protein YqeY
MSIETQIEQDIHDAMRSGDALRKSTLRIALSAMKMAEIDQGNSLDEAGYVRSAEEMKSRRGHCGCRTCRSS